MSVYAQAAEYYDLLYGGSKDYVTEATLIAETIRSRCKGARSILDVGCGTGAHARHLSDLGFEVDGLDVDETFVAIARKKCPDSSFSVADMRSFSLTKRYDAVISLFSAIGYVRDEAGLMATVRNMGGHLAPGGVVIVDPWFEPGVLTHGHVTTVVGETDGLSVCRMSRTLVEGDISRLEFEYLIGTPDGIGRRSETHELGLFTQAQMEGAFKAAGLSVERTDGALRARGQYVGSRLEDSSVER